MRANPTKLMICLAIMLCPAMMLCPSAEAQDADPFAPSQEPGNNAAAADPFGRPEANVASKNKPSDPVRRPQTATDKWANAEEKIQAILDQNVSATFVDTPLQDAVQYFSKQLDIPVVINTRALDELGLDSEEPVTLELKEVTLRSFLRLMLRDLDLTYMIKDEVLQITTLADAEDHLTVKMRVLPKAFAEKSDSLVSAITSTVVPATWQSTGGPSAIIAFDHVLIVSTTSDVHARVDAFLDKLTQYHAQPAE